MINQLSNYSSAVIKAGALGALAGFFQGYIYAKLSNLPTNQVAKAFAIWGIAQSTIFSVGNLCFKEKMPRRVFKVLTSVLIEGVAIRELEKRGLIGPKFKAFTIIASIALILSVPMLSLIESGLQKELDKRKKDLEEFKAKDQNDMSVNDVRAWIIQKEIAKAVEVILNLIEYAI